MDDRPRIDIRCPILQAVLVQKYARRHPDNTRSSLLVQLLIELGCPAPRKGKPVDQLFAKVQEWIDKNRGFAVALDEFDQLQGKTEVIYDLQLRNTEAENHVGIIMVSNQHPSTLQLDPRSQSRLNCQTLEFKPYRIDQLKQILEKRAELAFKPGKVQNEVIEEIAQIVSESGGDCRQALNHLLRAGRKAERRGDRKVLIRHL